MTKSETGFARTDDEAKIAKKLFLEGLSAGQLAKQLGTPGARPSRNAVIGKMDRMGVKRTASAIRATAALTRTQVSPKPKMPINFQSEFGALLTLHVPPTPVRYRCEPLPESRCVDLLEVEAHHCRWMIEKDGAEVYCGADKAHGSLCETHHGYAYYPTKVTAKEFARSLRRFA
ncbi:GcrA family cell cycle regulator [Paraburkholderia fungorum]|uniref:GcrA family cell cycle regulator n=1 Tax=Paraburkholderia fungorum TaxID=134537 RepID=UPI003D6C2F1E